MMPCESVIWNILPAIRRELTRKLVFDFRVKQRQAAQLIGMTDAAVSQYLSGKRGKFLITDPDILDDIAEIAQQLYKQEMKPEILFSSPMRRALETAEIINTGWDLPHQTAEWLHSGVEPSRIIGELKKISVKGIVIVGHLPSLGWLLSVLVWGLPAKEIIVPKGSVTLLKVSEWEPSGAKILEVLNPEFN